MIDDLVINQIKTLFKKHVYNSRCLYTELKKYPEIESWLVYKLKHTPQYESIGKIIISIVTNQKLDKCAVCGKLLKWTKSKKQHCKFCSIKCSGLSKEKYLRTKETCLERYGKDNVGKVPIIKNKIKETVLERYGVSNVNKLQSCKDKKEQTCFQRYQVKSFLETDDCRNKLKEYNQKTFNSNHEKTGSLFLAESFNKILKERLEPNNIIPLFSANDYKGTFIGTKVKHYKFKCSDCGREFISYLACGYIPLCKCKFKTNTSKGEKEVLEFIKSIYNNTICINDRKVIKPYELDIYLPDRKVALEFNGVYWHRLYEQEKPGYHKHKKLLCSKAGIKLINIGELNWLNNREQCKLKIKNKINE